MATEDKNNERITTKTRTRGSACVFVRVCARSACRNRHVQRYGRAAAAAAADFDGVRARGEGGCIHINIFLLTFFYYNYYLFGSLRAICRFLAADITERCFLFLDISMRNGTRTNPPTPLHPPPLTCRPRRRNEIIPAGRIHDRGAYSFLLGFGSGYDL